MNVSRIKHKSPFLLFLAVYFFAIYPGKEAKSQEVTINSFCAFSYSDPSERSSQDSIFFSLGNPKYCGNKISVKYKMLKDVDTLRKSVNKILGNLNLNKNRIVLGEFDYHAITGIFFKSDSSAICTILYQKDLVNDYWISIGVLCHELGHYLNDNERLCTNKEIELDADYFEGRAMAYLGARKEEALRCFNLSSLNGDSLHPPRNERINRSLAGFQNYFAGLRITSFTSANPVVYWKKYDDNDSIFIDDLSFAIPKLNGWDTLFTGDDRNPENIYGYIDPNLGILYLSKTNSTYELYNFKNADAGIGSLVNDKTSLTYMRFGSHSYRIYNKSKIVTFDEVEKDKNRILSNNLDYLVNIRNRETNKTDIVIFKNYTICPTKKLMPAFYK